MGKLIYFPAFGRADYIRMLLDHAKVKFEEETIQFSEWAQKKPTMPTGKLPVWVDDEGNVLT